MYSNYSIGDITTIVVNKHMLSTNGFISFSPFPVVKNQYTPKCSNNNNNNK